MMYFDCCCNLGWDKYANELGIYNNMDVSYRILIICSCKDDAPTCIVKTWCYEGFCKCIKVILSVDVFPWWANVMFGSKSVG